jgi:hypothetical protein
MESNKPNDNSQNWVQVELTGMEIKDHLAKLMDSTESKVLVNILLKLLMEPDQTTQSNETSKKISACELLLRDYKNSEEIIEACYCLVYGGKFQTYKYAPG